jgi:ArsR family transcriptional regulator
MKAVGDDLGLPWLVIWFRALADPSRLRILARLRDGPRCVEDLVSALAVPQPKVSRHLSYLRRAGLVGFERRGRRVYYQIVRPAAGFACRVLAELNRVLDTEPSVRADGRRLHQGH